MYAKGLQATLANAPSPYVVYGSCYANLGWGSDGEPASFADAVARATGIPVFASADSSSVEAGLKAVAAIQRQVAAGKAPKDAKPGQAMSVRTGQPDDQGDQGEQGDQGHD